MEEFVFEEESTIEATFQMDVISGEHKDLDGRDLPDQHPMSAITGLETALDNRVYKTSTASQVYGTDSEGNQTTYDVGSFGQVDDVQVGGVSVVTNKIAELGTMAGETASDYSTTAQANELYADKTDTYTKSEVDTALSGKQNTLTETQLNAVNSGIDSTKVAQIATNSENITSLQSGKADKATTLAGYGITDAYTKTEVDTALSGKQNNLDTTQMAAVNSGANATNIGQIATNTQAISDETTNRENADTNLQNQIDAIVSSSDVFDIVGTYSELQAYDISTVPVNDIIKVLVDSTHSGAATYYRCVETGGVKSWSYIGSEGAYYTKGEADSTFVPQTRTVNGKALSGNISLTYSDVGADASGSANTAETNAKNYADSLASNYATAAQGAKADTALQSGDNISELVNNAGYITGITSSDVTTALGYTPYSSANPSGYTSNVGTVTSVNNNLPDANGNVTISTGRTYTAGTGIGITNDVISVTSPTLVNRANNTSDLTICPNSTSAHPATANNSAINIGEDSESLKYHAVAVGGGSKSYSGNSIALGYGAKAGNLLQQNTTGYAIAIGYSAEAKNGNSIAIGSFAVARGDFSVQIGYGTNSEANSFYVSTSDTNNWKMLGSDGKIPSGRLTIATSVSSSSTNDETVGAKLFYDTCGDIETLINAL